MILILFLFSVINCFSHDIDTIIGNKLEFRSEYAFYDNLNSIIEISTNVIINNINETNNVEAKMKTSHAIINTSSSLVILDSDFSLETSSMMIKASNGKYDFSANWGVFNNGISYYDNFIIKGEKIKIEKNKYIYNKASFTTCDKEQPHYRISSSKIVFTPEKYFLSYNNFFYLGKIPLFYFPLIYKPLGEGTPLLSQFYPGYDDRNGFYIKSTLTYKFSSYTKFKLFVDWFSKKGFGFGGEVYKYKVENIKYDISYYRIDEKKSIINWGFNGGLWANVYKKDDSNIYIQSYIRLMNTPEFNNNYFRTNPFAISDNKQFDFSLTYRMRDSYLRINRNLFYNRVDDYNFVESRNISPKIEYQMLTKKIKFFPLNHSLYLSVENSRYNNSFFQKHANISYVLSNTSNLSRLLSFFNSVNYLANIDFSTSSYNHNLTTSRYIYNSSLRYSTLSNSYNLSYTGIFRAMGNRFSIDSRALDNGIEKSSLNLELTFFNRIDKYLRFNSDYDLRKNKNLDFKNRFSPISLEYYKKLSNYEIYLKDDYSITKGNKSIIAQINSEYYNNYLNIGVANYSSKSERIIFSNTLGYYPSKKYKWYGEFVLRYYIDFSNDMGVKFFEKAFVLNKEFHDFRVRFLFRNRRKVNEFFFYITMKMNDPYRKNNIDREVDEFFKPWRKFDEERDY